MTSFVLDASVAFSWCFPGDPTENTPYSRAVLNRLEQADAVVPEIWPYEIANSIFVAFSRRKRITEEQIGEYLQSLKLLPIRVEHHDLWTSVSLESLARKHGLAVYDASLSRPRTALGPAAGNRRRATEKGGRRFRRQTRGTVTA